MEIAEVMISLLESGYSIEALIKEFAGSHSLTVASACCVSAALLLKRSRPLSAYRDLADLVSALTFRFNYNIVNTILSAACYCGATINNLEGGDQVAIAILCSFGLDFAESQLAGDAAELSNAIEVIQLINILLEVVREVLQNENTQSKILLRVDQVNTSLRLAGG